MIRICKVESDQVFLAPESSAQLFADGICTVGVVADCQDSRDIANRNKLPDRIERIGQKETEIVFMFRKQRRGAIPGPEFAHAGTIRTNLDCYWWWCLR